jgi:5-methylcytosine-specific restriction endonuclease McrA
MAARTCHCGQPIAPGRRRHCSTRCMKAATRKVVLERAECAECGAVFLALPITNEERRGWARYCSPECQAAARRARPRRPPASAIRYAECAECAGVFVHPARKRRRFCSPRCVAAARRAPRSTPISYDQCRQCGAAFVCRPRGPLRYCSRVCRTRYLRPINAARRRSRKAGNGPVDRITHIALAERDRWRCHLCRRKVTRRTWSIDHLIPLSAGGLDRWDNVALAHRSCNVERGTRGAAQLRLIS